MAVIEFGNFLWNGQDRRYFKAVATLISGYRLFFWLKIRCFKGIKGLCFSTGRNNIYWYIEFTGVVEGGGFYFPPARKKNIFDQYLAVDNPVDKLLLSLAICNHSCILRIIRLLKNWMSIKGTIQIQRLLVYPISVGTYI